MKVKIVKAKSDNRWYSEKHKNMIDKVFKVHFSEEQSKKLRRSVFEIQTGKYKGRMIDVKDTKIVIKSST